MGVTEVIVDTCFLQKISKDGKNVDNIKKILDELNFSPVLHPYIYKTEILDSKLNKFIENGYIRVASWNEIIPNTNDKIIYNGYFETLYAELKKFLETCGSNKSKSMFCDLSGVDIYTIHKAGSNLGDVHIILMALFMGLPIVLTEDSDIEILRTIVKRRTGFAGEQVQILDGVDLIKSIAKKENVSISKKDLIDILQQMGERAYRSEINSIWNENH